MIIAKLKMCRKIEKHDRHEPVTREEFDMLQFERERERVEREREAEGLGI